jgi:CRP-like cAMP-binding protein
MLCGIAEGSVMMACPHPVYGLLNVHLKSVGGWFGIAGLHFNVDRIFSAFARGPTRLVILHRAAYLQIRDSDSEFENALDTLQLIDFHLILRSGLDLLVRDSRLRLISRLMTISEIELTAPASMPIQLPLTHDELATMCNLSRKTVQAYLDELEKQGLCKVGYRSLEITDPSALVQLIKTSSEAD